MNLKPRPLILVVEAGNHGPIDYMAYCHWRWFAPHVTGNNFRKPMSYVSCTNPVMFDLMRNRFKSVWKRTHNIFTILLILHKLSKVNDMYGPVINQLLIDLFSTMVGTKLISKYIWRPLRTATWWVTGSLSRKPSVFKDSIMNRFSV